MDIDHYMLRPLLTVEQFAALNGVTDRTVRRWIASGMPRRQAGPKSAIRIDPTEAGRWLSECRCTHRTAGSAA